MKRVLLLLIMGGLFLPSCARSGSRWVQVGYASYYSDEFQGRKTACGEIYDRNRYTAAHRSLPCGTTVKVVNLENGKSVVVRINDRGPFVRSRIIDLSRAAAEKIDMIRKGVVKVRIEVVK